VLVPVALVGRVTVLAVYVVDVLVVRDGLVAASLAMLVILVAFGLGVRPLFALLPTTVAPRMGMTVV
jgi:hypothetical protein